MREKKGRSEFSTRKGKRKIVKAKREVKKAKIYIIEISRSLLSHLAHIIPSFLTIIPISSSSSSFFFLPYTANAQRFILSRKVCDSALCDGNFKR